MLPNRSYGTEPQRIACPGPRARDLDDLRAKVPQAREGPSEALAAARQAYAR